jgi:hypothetical protein
MGKRKDPNESDVDREKNEETTHSGKAGERERNTPGRTPRELGLDPEEVRGHGVVGDSPEGRTGDVPLTGMGRPVDRTNPPLMEGVDGIGEGGVSASGGRAGGARGNSGTSASGAGGPEGESRGGPGEYKGTSRFDLDRGTVEEPSTETEIAEPKEVNRPR